MSTEENKVAIRGYIECLNAGDLVGLARFFVPEVVANGQAIGFAEYVQAVSALLAALPDVQLSIEELIAEGDTVAGRGTFRGTHRGELLGIAPTGKHVAFSSIGVWRLRDGKITELWFNRDMLSLLRQLGATITPPAPVAG